MYINNIHLKQIALLLIIYILDNIIIIHEIINWANISKQPFFLQILDFKIYITNQYGIFYVML